MASDKYLMISERVPSDRTLSFGSRVCIYEVGKPPRGHPERPSGPIPPPSWKKNASVPRFAGDRAPRGDGMERNGPVDPFAILPDMGHVRCDAQYAAYVPRFPPWLTVRTCRYPHLFRLLCASGSVDVPPASPCLAQDTRKPQAPQVPYLSHTSDLCAEEEQVAEAAPPLYPYAVRCPASAFKDTGGK